MIVSTISNGNIVIDCCLVATLLSAMWHLQTPPSFSFCCDVVLVMLVVGVVGMVNGCKWRPLVMVVVVVKQGWW